MAGKEMSQQMASTFFVHSDNALAGYHVKPGVLESTYLTKLLKYEGLFLMRVLERKVNFWQELNNCKFNGATFFKQNE